MISIRYRAREIDYLVSIAWIDIAVIRTRSHLLEALDTFRLSVKIPLLGDLDKKGDPQKTQFLQLQWLPKSIR